MLIDSHCHLLDLADPMLALRRAAESRVVVVGVTDTPAEFEAARRRFGGLRHVRLAVGLHPLAAAHATRRDLALLESAAASVDYIGEVGLDLSLRGRATEDKQRAVLEHLLSSRALSGKVWTLHSRSAAEGVISMLESRRHPMTPILHWFTGPTRLVERAIDVGCYFSVNEAMLESDRGRSLVAAIPRARLLTETDAPYTVAASGPSAPADVVRTVHRLAGVIGITPREAEDTVFANMAEAFAAAARP